MALTNKILELSKKNYSVAFFPKDDLSCFSVRVYSPTRLFFSERMIPDKELDYLEKNEEHMNDILDDLVFKLEQRLEEIAERVDRR